MTVGFAAGTPQRSNTRSRPRDVDMAEGGFKRRDPAFAKVARWRFPSDSLAEIASEDDGAELHAQVADEQQESDADGPPLGTLVVHVNIGDCEIGTRLAGRPPELAGDHHAFNSPC